MHQTILITIDTLRADHLGNYGYDRNVSPVLDSLSAEGITFDWAFSPISYTAPAHFAVMTSRFPSFHGVQFHNGCLPSLNASDVTIAEILSQKRIATSAFISASVMSLENLRPMGKGFETYNDEMTHHESNREVEYRRWAANTNEAALEWLCAHRKGPFFCWIHYMDVHGPYETPPPHCDLFVDEIHGVQPRNLQAVPDGQTGGLPAYQLLRPIRDKNGRLVDYERDYNYYLARYDGGIHYVDWCIGTLIEELKRLGVYEDLFLIVTSDHGEALGEGDAFFFHSLTVSIDQIRVPLIMKFPSQCEFPSKRVAVQVSTLDIAPTILDFLALGGLNAQGVSLLPLIRGNDLERFSRRVVFSETETQISAVDCKRQLLLGRGVPEEQQFPFYHPDAPVSKAVVDYRGGRQEPGCVTANFELEDLATEFHEQARKSVASHPTAAAAHRDNEKIQAHLKALGYIP